ncbi:hypothetical protein [Pseudomonas sp. F1002]|uniref:hypothetical protein n=1 Tax=Pseudomonas sp. F1002 TaxID=2738821 RepID=UPI0015A29683|nr:hypothetical protein [Pseudomonas sp. F1002]NWB63557.1 hypothetical protein [Pseudomonas sp. F1002]
MLNRYPGFAVTGRDGLPYDQKGDPDLHQAISIELALASNGRIKLSIELQGTNASGPVFMPHVVLVDKITDESFNAIRAKCEVDGWTIHSWSVSEQLPYDEGYAAAMARQDSDANPYAQHYWKHDEWYLGWTGYQETNA